METSHSSSFERSYRFGNSDLPKFLSTKEGDWLVHQLGAIFRKCHLCESQKIKIRYLTQISWKKVDQKIGL